MNIFLVPVGSHGDVHPFCGIGEALLRRGHRVTMFTNGLFEPLARRVGMDFVEVGTADQFKQIIADPELWHPTRGWKKVFASMGEFMALQYDALKARLTPDSIIVGASLAFGARVLRDKLGVPLATVHLQPSVIRSAIEPPVLPGMPPLGWMPAWMIRAIFNFADFAVLDPVIGKPLNAFRAQHGLKPVRWITSEWWHSPDLAIGLFPDWFAKPQADWPRQLKVTGFPMFDERGHEPLSDDLQRFLSQGDQPIAFTPGSAMFHGQAFFQAAAHACKILGKRGLLLTRHPENIPTNLPPGVIHVPYAPFSELLPQCSAIVHHGGIGTTAQALAAGVPQLIQPMSHDQPDNAERVKRLGVGDSISVKSFRGRAVARKLRALLDSAPTQTACNRISSLFSQTDPIVDTCNLIESLAKSATKW